MNLEHDDLSRTTCYWRMLEFTNLEFKKESPWKSMKLSYKKRCFPFAASVPQVVTWGDEMYGGNCRALKDQLKDVQGIQVSRH